MTGVYGPKPFRQDSVNGGCLSKCPYNKTVLTNTNSSNQSILRQKEIIDQKK